MNNQYCSDKRNIRIKKLITALRQPYVTIVYRGGVALEEVIFLRMCLDVLWEDSYLLSDTEKFVDKVDELAKRLGIKINSQRRHRIRHAIGTLREYNSSYGIDLIKTYSDNIPSLNKQK